MAISGRKTSGTKRRTKVVTSRSQKTIESSMTCRWTLLCSMPNRQVVLPCSDISSSVTKLSHPSFFQQGVCVCVVVQSVGQRVLGPLCHLWFAFARRPSCRTCQQSRLDTDAHTHTQEIHHHARTATEIAPLSAREWGYAGQAIRIDLQMTTQTRKSLP